MKDKKEAFSQLNNIHNYLVDSEDIVPINPNILFASTFASAIMFLFFEYILNFGVYYAVFFLICVSFLLFVVEFFMVRSKNETYDIVNATNNQIIVNCNYVIAILFGIVLTLVFNLNHIGLYSYPAWVFLIAFANLNAGFIFNRNSFKVAGIFGLIVGILLFAIELYFDNNILSIYYKFISTIACSGSLFYIGLILKKSEKRINV